jgi:hypothetical protein
MCLFAKSISEYDLGRSSGWASDSPLLNTYSLISFAVLVPLISESQFFIHKLHQIFSFLSPKAREQDKYPKSNSRDSSNTIFFVFSFFLFFFFLVLGLNPELVHARQALKPPSYIPALQMLFLKFKH